MERAIEVHPPTSPIVRTRKGPKIEVPKGETPLSLVVRALPKGSPLAKVLDALRYLSGYPHG